MKKKLKEIVLDAFSDRERARDYLKTYFEGENLNRKFEETLMGFGDRGNHHLYRDDDTYVLVHSEGISMGDWENFLSDFTDLEDEILRHDDGENVLELLRKARAASGNSFFLG